jgi:hypothetical protein
VGSITGPYVAPARAADLNMSAFNERIHQPSSTSAYRLTPAWQHKLHSFRVKPAISEDALKAALDKDLTRNNLDEIAVKASDGLHVVYGRGIASDISAGDTFVSNELKGTIIGISREVTRDYMFLRVKNALRMTVAVATPFVTAFTLGNYLMDHVNQLAGLGALYAGFFAGIGVAITGVSGQMNFGESKKEFAADKDSLAALALDPAELVTPAKAG